LWGWMDNIRSMRRSEIMMRCPCRTIDGVPLELELLDLSERGCRARVIGFPLQFGQALRLFPEGCEAFTAIVRRAESDTVGIEFDRELPHPVFERMRCYAPTPEDCPDQVANEPIDEPDAIESVTTIPIVPLPCGSLLDAERVKPRKKMALS
jgi:hypothetical protein